MGLHDTNLLRYLCSVEPDAQGTTNVPPYSCVEMNFQRCHLPDLPFASSSASLSACGLPLIPVLVLSSQVSNPCASAAFLHTCVPGTLSPQPTRSNARSLLDLPSSSFKDAVTHEIWYLATVTYSRGYYLFLSHPHKPGEKDRCCQGTAVVWLGQGPNRLHPTASC